MEESAYKALLDVKVAKASGAGTRRENSAIRDGGGRPSERGSRRQVCRDLFLVTLEKALFSSPAACRATVEKRIRRCELEMKGWGRETRAAAESDGAVAAEIASLLTLRDALAAIGPGDYAKYQALLDVEQLERQPYIKVICVPAGE